MVETDIELEDSPLIFQRYSEYRQLDDDDRTIPDRVLFEFIDDETTGNVLIAAFSEGITDYRLVVNTGDPLYSDRPVDLTARQVFQYSLVQITQDPVAALQRGLLLGDPFMVQYAVLCDKTCVHSLSLPAIISMRRKIFPALFVPADDDPVDEKNATIGNLLAASWMYYAVNSLL